MYISGRFLQKGRLGSLATRLLQRRPYFQVELSNLVMHSCLGDCQDLPGSARFSCALFEHAHDDPGARSFIAAVCSWLGSLATRLLALGYLSW